LTYLVVAVAIAVATQVVLVLTRRHVWFELKDGIAQAWREAMTELRQKNGEQRNPVGEPVSEAERDTR